MHWKCLFVYKNTCNLKPATLWLLAVIFASIVFLCTLFISVFLPVCVYDAEIRQESFPIDMLEDSFPTQTARFRDAALVQRLQNNISKLSLELRQLRATLSVYERLGKLMEKDSSLATFGNKRHQNVMITSVPHSGELLLGELFNQHRDVFYLFEPFHSMKYFRENRPPEVYTSILRSFLQGILGCDFTKFTFYTDFLSKHYRALVHRLSSRTLSSPPLCPEFVPGRFYNIRFCTHLQPPTLNAICKLHDYTVVKTTQLVDLDRIAQLEYGTRNLFRVVELVRDPRAVLYTQSREIENASETWLVNEASKICTQQIRNRRYLENSEIKKPGRFITIKYEDFVSSPLEGFQNLSNVLGLPRSRHASQMLEGVLKDGFTWPMTTEGKETVNDTRTKINLTQSVSEWQNGLDTWQIRSIERECSTAMNMLGYKTYDQISREGLKSKI